MRKGSQPKCSPKKPDCASMREPRMYLKCRDDLFMATRQEKPAHFFAAPDCSCRHFPALDTTISNLPQSLIARNAGIAPMDPGEIKTAEDVHRLKESWTQFLVGNAVTVCHAVSPLAQASY
jgi:hypothetical protein